MKSTYQYALTLAGLICMPLQLSADQSLTRDYLSIGIGALGIYETELYRDLGSDTIKKPNLNLSYKKFEFTGSTLSYSLYKKGFLEIKPLISLEFDGYEAEESDFLEGMDDRDESVYAGFVVEREFGLGYYGIWDLEFSFKHDIGNKSDGQIAELEFGSHRSLTDRLSLGYFTGLSWYSGDFSDYYFGVKNDEATAEREAYSLGSTLNPYAGFSARYQITKSLSIGALVEYNLYDSEISDSPIVDSDNQLNVFLRLEYQFFRRF